MAFDPEGWTTERAADVAALFERLADDWNSRDKPGREDPLLDALARGEPGTGRCIEIGSGTGSATRHLRAQFDVVVAVDLSFAMLAQAPSHFGGRVKADAARLPVPDRTFDSIALQNAFLFPHEVDRVLRAHGTVVWVSSRGPFTPIYLSAEEIAEALPGEWQGVTAVAGEGSWSVLRRADPDPGI